MKKSEIIRKELKQITTDSRELSEQLAYLAVRLRLLNDRIQICVDLIKSTIKDTRQ